MSALDTPPDGPTYHLLLALHRDLAARCAVMVAQVDDLTAHLHAWLDDHSLRRSILVVDDDVTLVAPLKDGLESAGYRVAVAFDAAAGAEPVSRPTSGTRRP